MSEDKVNTDDVNEMVCGVEERRDDGTAKLKQPSMVVEEEGRKKIVRLRFFGNQVSNISLFVLYIIITDCQNNMLDMSA